MIRDNPLTLLGQEARLSQMHTNRISNRVEKEVSSPKNCPLTSTDVHTSHMYTGGDFVFISEHLRLNWAQINKL